MDYRPSWLARRQSSSRPRQSLEQKMGHPKRHLTQRRPSWHSKTINQPQRRHIQIRNRLLDRRNQPRPSRILSLAESQVSRSPQSFGPQSAHLGVPFRGLGSRPVQFWDQGRGLVCGIDHWQGRGFQSREEGKYKAGIFGSRQKLIDSIHLNNIFIYFMFSIYSSYHTNSIRH